MSGNTSTQDREPALVRDFSKLYKYVYNVGRYVNLIYERLDNIETQIEEVSKKFDEQTTVNRRSIADIQEKIFTKSEFEEFIKVLKAEIEEELPSLPEILETSKETLYPSRLSPIPEPPQPPQEEKKRRGIFG